MYEWSFAVGSGPRAFAVRATDAAGNVTTSPIRSITLGDGAPPPPVGGPPKVAVDAPGEGVTHRPGDRIEVRVTASIGMKIPFCAGAFGKAFLAYLPPETVERLLAHPGLRAFTSTSITDADQYRAALAAIRAQGYAVDDNEEYLRGVGAISVPIFAPASTTLPGQTGAREVAAVMTLVGFSSQLSPQKMAEFSRWMLAAGREISEKLGVSV